MRSPRKKENPENNLITYRETIQMTVDYTSETMVSRKQWNILSLEGKALSTQISVSNKNILEESGELKILSGEGRLREFIAKSTDLKQLIRSVFQTWKKWYWKPGTS